MTQYILDQTWTGEAERLRSVEAWADPVSTDHLRTLGIGSGWRCLEVGAGHGSIARWMAQQVGESGHVLATDIDTTLLDPLAGANLEVCRADVLSDPLPGGFDLVHARLLVAHLQDRRTALLRMIHALRPGGILFVEENDFVWTDVGAWPCYPSEHGDVVTRTWQASIDLWKRGGYAGHWGRRLASEFRELGLDDVGGEARARIDGSAADVARLSVERFREQLVADGRLSQNDIDRYCAVMRDSETLLTSPLQVSIWGRRPVEP